MEILFQPGHAGDQTIRAWTVVSDTGFTFLALPWSSRRGVKADIARGDKMDLQPVLTIKPAHALILVLGGIFCGNIIRKTGFKLRLPLGGDT